MYTVSQRDFDTYGNVSRPFVTRERGQKIAFRKEKSACTRVRAWCNAIPIWLQLEKKEGREREREGSFYCFTGGIKFRGSNGYLAWSSRDYRYNLCASLEIATELVTLVITLTKPLPYSWPADPPGETDQGFKPLNAPLSNELFRVEIRLAPRSKWATGA